MPKWEHTPPHAWVEQSLRTNNWVRLGEAAQERIEEMRWNSCLPPIMPPHERLAQRILEDIPGYLAKTGMDRYVTGAWAHLTLGNIDAALALLEPMARVMLDERPAGVSDTYQPPMDALKLLILALIQKGDGRRILERGYLTKLHVMARGVAHQEDASQLAALFLERWPDLTALEHAPSP